MSVKRGKGPSNFRLRSEKSIYYTKPAVYTSPPPILPQYNFVSRVEFHKTYSEKIEGSTGQTKTTLRSHIAATDVMIEDDDATKNNNNDLKMPNWKTRKHALVLL